MALKEGYKSLSLIETIGDLKKALNEFKDSDKIVNHTQISDSKYLISELHIYKDVFEDNQVVFTSESIEELHGYYPNGEEIKK